jgi:hypothetical protein
MRKYSGYFFKKWEEGRTIQRWNQKSCIDLAGFILAECAFAAP